MKRQKRLTCKDKKAKFGNVRAYLKAKRKKAGRGLNRELNKVEASIHKNTKDLDPEFSKAVDENFWDLV